MGEVIRPDRWANPPNVNELESKRHVSAAIWQRHPKNTDTNGSKAGRRPRFDPPGGGNAA